jgi:hypothetical protein
MNFVISISHMISHILKHASCEESDYFHVTNGFFQEIDH